MKPTIEQVDAAVEVLKNAPIAFSKDESVFCFEPSQYKTAIFALRFLRLAIDEPDTDQLKAMAMCESDAPWLHLRNALINKLLEKADTNQ